MINPALTYKHWEEKQQNKKEPVTSFVMSEQSDSLRTVAMFCHGPNRFVDLSLVNIFQKTLLTIIFPINHLVCKMAKVISNDRAPKQSQCAVTLFTLF